MSAGDPPEDDPESSRESDTPDESQDASDVRERLEESADRAVEGFDEGVIDLLSWVLETNTRARIYVHLRQHPDSTSDEIAEGTGLYPSTVREALAELHEEGTVQREKRESDGAGNNPYEYRAIAPSTLVRSAVEEIQGSLNDVFQLDRYMGGEDTSDQEPVTITVEAEDGDEDDSEDEWGETPADGGEQAEASDADDETGSNDADGAESEGHGGGGDEDVGAETQGGDEAETEEDDEDAAEGDDEEQDEDIQESL